MQWWKLEGEELHRSVYAAAQSIQQSDPRVADLLAWADLYNDQARDDWAMRGLFRDRRARINALQSIVDTVTAKLARSRTRPWIVTASGDWEARSRAKLSTLWLDGQFEALSIYEKADVVLQDAAIFGAGALKLYHQDGELNADVVWPGDLFVDPREERHRCVRTLYQVAGYDKGVLAARYPKHRAAIERAGSYEDRALRAHGTGPADLVQVIEVWRLPDGDAACGRHVIVIDGACLLDEEWERDCFPFAVLQWSRAPLRFWGSGLVALLSGAQAQLNRIAATLEDAYEHCPPASLWCESDAQIDVLKIDNSPWKIHTYQTGSQPPFVLTPNAISGDFSMREETLLSRMYAISGVSEMSAASVKPAGLNSGKAMLVHQDVESERFYAQARALEQWHVAVAQHLIALAEEVVEDEEIEDKSALDALGGRKTLEAVSYVDARLGDRPHMIRVFPVSSLATSPQGRLQQVADLMQLGILTDTNAARELLEFPDLDRYNAVESAGRDLVDRTIGECLRGNPKTAHPLMPLDYVVRKGTLEHDLAELDGCDEDGLQCLRDFISMAQTLMVAAAPPPAPALPGAPMPGGPMPPGGAMPPAPPEMGVAP